MAKKECEKKKKCDGVHIPCDGDCFQCKKCGLSADKKKKLCKPKARQPKNNSH